MQLSYKTVLLLLGFLSLNSVDASSLLSRLKRSSNPACLQKPLSGHCMAYLPRYYYNASSDTCRQFVYGGCGGNDNRFTWGRDCVAACGGTVDDFNLGPAPASAIVGDSGSLYFPGEASDHPERYGDVDPCVQPLNQGGCQDRKTRYYYDSGECKPFEYNGCAGNMNNFLSEQECLDRCGN